ncbi:MAG: hypothetical protein ACRCYT_09440 [Cetobacterium sp.]
MNVEELEKMSEIQKKNGSYNYMLTVCMALTILCVGTIIYQNTKVLENISNKLNDITTSNVMLISKMGDIEKKVDMLFLDKYEIKKKDEK